MGLRSVNSHELQLCKPSACVCAGCQPWIWKSPSKHCGCCCVKMLILCKYSLVCTPNGSKYKWNKSIMDDGSRWHAELALKWSWYLAFCWLHWDIRHLCTEMSESSSWMLRLHGFTGSGGLEAIKWPVPRGWKGRLAGCCRQGRPGVTLSCSIFFSLLHSGPSRSTKSLQVSPFLAPVHVPWQEQCNL